ncbi:MAG: GAF domain-containing protein [Chloroflexi bacterium]|nr:GAF domain-containing protein [Chloroflexota bacterium]
MTRTNTFRYTLFGAFFGLLFPLVATLLDFFYIAKTPLESLSLEAVIQIQTGNPLHWIIDSAPLVVGIIASIAGRRQDASAQLNEKLSEQIYQHSKLAFELEQNTENLEENVNQRTEELNRRATYLEAAGLVARDATSILDPQELITRAATLIAEHFGFYHVGIFLIDQKNEWAILRAASSPGGHQMISRGHRLPVGKQGIVGYVTGIGQPRVAQSIGEDKIHSLTTELPETRSEMALPLRARGEILGALDIQDSKENAFSDEDVSVLQTLADQIALAISNAKLYQEAQENLQEVQRTRGDSSTQAWDQANRHSTLPMFRFSDGEVSPLDLADEPLSGNAFKLPIRVRGEIIGEIDIQKDDSNLNDWAEEELKLMETLADQVGIALDSAKLFQETRNRAVNEKLVSEITTHVRGTLDVETILKTAAQEVRKTLNLPEVTIRLASIPDSEPGTSNNGQSETLDSEYNE